MKKRLMNNLSLKIAAFLFAVVLWLVVVNINDPVEKQTFRDITVKILHEEIISNTGKTYKIQNESNKISVVVTAKRSVLEDIRTENIVATADVRDMELSTLLPIKISITGFEGKYKTAAATPNNVEIKQETVIQQTFPISVSTVGNLQNGYILSEAMPNPESVQLSGPRSLVGRVAKVVARVDIEGISEDTVLDGELIIYDGGGNVLDQTSLTTRNLGKSGTVKVKLTLLSTRAVPIELDTSQIGLKSGYKLGGITCEPEKVLLAGKTDDLTALEKLELPAEALATEGLSSKKAMTVDVSQYLPENIQLADENEKNIVVTISVEQLDTKTFDLPFDSLKKSNVPDGFRVEAVDQQEVELRFTGKEEALNQLTENQVLTAAYIDLKDAVKEGTYKVSVQVPLENGCQLVAPVEINIKLVKLEPDIQTDEMR